MVHPDMLQAGLEKELARFPDRAEEIKAEIERVSGLDRPAIAVEEPDTVVNPLVGYLEGLKKELSRCSEEVREGVEKEIKRVKAELHRGEVEQATAAPGETRSVPDARRRGRSAAEPSEDSTTTTEQTAEGEN